MSIALSPNDNLTHPIILEPCYQRILIEYDKIVISQRSIILSGYVSPINNTPL